MRNAGFTLLETLVYIGLFSIMITGVISSVYTIAEAGAEGANDAMVNDEALWILESLKNGAKDPLVERFFISSQVLMQKYLGKDEAISGNDYKVENFEWLESSAMPNNPHSIKVSFTLSKRGTQKKIHQNKFSEVIYPIP